MCFIDYSGLNGKVNMDGWSVLFNVAALEAHQCFTAKLGV